MKYSVKCRRIVSEGGFDDCETKVFEGITEKKVAQDIAEFFEVDVVYPRHGGCFYPKIDTFKDLVKRLKATEFPYESFVTEDRFVLNLNTGKYLFKKTSI